MRNILAVFNNRNQAMQLSTNLKRMGIRCKTINTPRELSEDCSLSVLFLERDLPQIRYVVSKNVFSAFKGLYIVTGDLFRKYIAI